MDKLKLKYNSNKTVLEEQITKALAENVETQEGKKYSYGFTRSY